MGLLIGHWRCLLPIAAVAAAAIFMRRKPKAGAGSEFGDDRERLTERSGDE
ncbi:MAG: hypothetical protein LBD92_06410 [Oscillospiraceae bacterium]|nr:hypothetical protein [Oscillospiraceae bacterium]